MKFNKIIKTACIAVGALFITNQATSQLTLGGGFAYGSEIDEPGINLRAGALVTPVVHLGGDFNYFFPGDDGAADIDVYDINLNLSFRLNADILYIYPLVGLNYTSVKNRLFGIESTNTEVGANLGAGAGINFGPLSPFVEYKYVASEYDQSVFTVGLLITVGGEK